MIENGGGVCQKSYSKSYGKILGYGLPDWSLVSMEEQERNPAGSRKMVAGGIILAMVSRFEMTGTGMRTSGTGLTAPA